MHFFHIQTLQCDTKYWRTVQLASKNARMKVTIVYLGSQENSLGLRNSTVLARVF